MSWTAERVEQARVLFIDQKMSARETAVVMGGGLTNNSIVSMARRMGWDKSKTLAEGKPKPVPALRAPKPPRPPKVEKAKPEPKLGVPFPKLSPEETDQVRAARAATGRHAIKGMDAVANDNAVPLMERKFGQCAWPVGTPEQPRDQLACGAPTYQGIDNCSYCVTHAKRAFARDVTQPKPKDNIVRAVRRWAA